LAVNYRALGFRPPMLLSSLGRCYLSFCPEDERREILAALARSPNDFDRTARRPENIRRMVAHARDLGYVARDPTSTSMDSPDRFGAISVPLRQGELVVGCLSCAWLPAVKSEREIVSAHLADLQQAAQNIERKLAQAGFEPPPASS
jgi:IclR family mhp operon transcriptional activator